MLDPKSVSESEEKCLRLIVSLIERGEVWSGLKKLKDAGLVVSEQEWLPLMQMMEHCGAIQDITHTMGLGGQYWGFKLSPQAKLIVRDLDRVAKEADQPGDIVADIQKKVRSGWGAWLILGFFILTAAFTLLNQGVQFFQNIGWVAKPK